MTDQKKTDHFQSLGVSDYAEGNPYHPGYDTWSILEQHAYELGRLSALIRRVFTQGLVP